MFIENYTWSNNGPNLRHPPVIKNDFETHFVLIIIRQYLEFIKLNRSQSKYKKDTKQEKPAEPIPNKIPPAEAKEVPKSSLQPREAPPLTPQVLLTRWSMRCTSRRGDKGGLTILLLMPA
jgi:hypothetical protein